MEVEMYHSTCMFFFILDSSAIGEQFYPSLNNPQECDEEDQKSNGDSTLHTNGSPENCEILKILPPLGELVVHEGLLLPAL